jgi:hypothetical protein
MARTTRQALEYASRGWSVVPVHTARVGRCSCGRDDCPAPGKHPRVRWEAAMHEAASPEQVASWWDRWPDANIAVVTGSVSGIAVLDVDPRAGGEEALERLEGRWGALPRTVEARSGGGGRHLWFATKEELPSAVLAAGLELKAERATVIAPPSVHASGGRYEWLPGLSSGDVEMAPLPEWLAAFAHGDPEARARHPLADVPVRTRGEQDEFAAAWERAGVTLRPGDHYYLCPFHPDTHPSLHVDADGCRWFCFGCRRGGGIGRLLRLLGESPRPVERGRRRGHVGEPLPVTLAGDVEVQVTGESPHQDELLSLSGGRRTYGGVDLDVEAELVLVLDDPFETVVVAVLVDGRPIGRMQLDDAKRFQRSIERARHLYGAATCRARIRGGWDRGGEDVGALGVVLLLPAVPQAE